MNWDDLRYVLAVFREGTLSGAAQALETTHTTVGRRVRGLEEDLGVRLFDRDPSGWLPTAEGSDLAELALDLETRVLQAQGRLSGRDARLSGRLRVTTMDLVFAGFPELFSSFQERYPGVDLTVTVTNDQVSLRRREADVALRLSDTPAPHLFGRRVGALAFAPYASRGLVERAGADASALPWIGWDEREDNSMLDAWLERHAPGARITLRLGITSLALRAAVSAGLGVHFLPVFDGESSDEFVRVGPVDMGFKRDLWLLTLDELRSSARVRAFMEHAWEHLTPLRAELSGEALTQG